MTTLALQPRVKSRVDFYYPYSYPYLYPKGIPHLWWTLISYHTSLVQTNYLNS